ncbi:MAG: hypothetical protein ACAI43_03865 [Phycisphaerae bacterium]
MDFLKTQATKIREQLAGLSSSQKMLAGTLVVIMVMTLLWWSKYAGTTEMEPVLEQDFAAEELTRVKALVDAKGIPAKIVGSKLHVATDRKFEVLALLGYEQLLPRDTASGFDEIVAKMDSPFAPQQKQDAMYNRAKEVTLAQVLRAFPGVRNATVMIDATSRRAFGDAARQPSATVNLQTKNPGDKPSKKLIEGAAATVAGAVSGLQRSRINVVIDGASYNVADRDPEAGGSANGDSWMDLLKEGERHFSQKVLGHLGYINGVMVSVSVDPNMDVKRIEREVFDKAKTFDKVIQTSEKTSESTNSSRTAGEPGAVPNATVTGGGANQGMTLGAGGGRGGGGAEGSSTNDAENTARMQVFPAVMREWIRSPAGAAAVTGASVTIPRSHFVRIFKAINPSAADPDPATLDPIIKLEMPKLKNAVLGCLGQVAAEKIAVDWYYDYMPTTGGDPAAPAVATSVPLALAGHAKEIALGGLALVSLFMVMMMVRKSAPPTIVIPKPERPVPVAPPPTDVAGEVGEGTQSMEAMEVDDESIRTTQIIGQVSALVKENPDAAANLVKRWLNRS